VLDFSESNRDERTANKRTRRMTAAVLVPRHHDPFLPLNLFPGSVPPLCRPCARVPVSGVVPVSRREAALDASLDHKVSKSETKDDGQSELAESPDSFVTAVAETSPAPSPPGPASQSPLALPPADFHLLALAAHSTAVPIPISEAQNYDGLVDSDDCICDNEGTIARAKMAISEATRRLKSAQTLVACAVEGMLGCEKVTEASLAELERINSLHGLRGKLSEELKGRDEEKVEPDTGRRRSRDEEKEQAAKAMEKAVVEDRVRPRPPVLLDLSNLPGSPAVPWISLGTATLGPGLAGSSVETIALKYGRNRLVSTAPISLTLAASNEQLRRIQTVTALPNSTCEICLEPMNATDKVWQFPCSHQFHGLCASNHLSKAGTCFACSAYI